MSEWEFLQNTPKEEYLQYFIMSKNQNNAIVAYQGRPANVAEQMMKRVLASKSESKYKNHNTTFILWLKKKSRLKRGVSSGLVCKATHIERSDRRKYKGTQEHERNM